MKHKIISLSILLAFTGLANASEKTGDLKSSATINATCLISSDNIGFGAIVTPLVMQTSQSDMTVKCSNATAYTIDLAYGGVYGENSNKINYNVTQFQTSSGYNSYYVSNAEHEIGRLNCYTNGLVFFTTLEVAKAYGYNSVGSSMDTKAVCNGKTISSLYLSVSGNAYDYGIMNGLSKGDKLAYSIQVPGDSSKVWNKGNNSYKSTGSGDSQTIPMIAKIVPDKSGSKYPAPDMYLDTITAVISY